MKRIFFAAALATATACVAELDTSVDEAEVWTDLDRNNLQHPLRIKSTINTGGTGMCMDVAGGYTATNTPIVQYPCHSGLAQQFYLYNVDWGSKVQIRSRLDTRMCVGIGTNNQLALMPCESGATTVPVTKWTHETTTGQQTISYIRFRSAASTCIDIPNGSNWHSLILQAYACHAGQNQVWAVTNL